MNRTGMRWTTGLVAAFTVIGMIGFAKSHGLQPSQPSQPFGELAAFAAGSALRLQLELPGGGALNPATLLSAKPETGGAAAAKEVGTSPGETKPEADPASGAPDETDAEAGTAESGAAGEPAAEEPNGTERPAAQGAASAATAPASVDRKVAFIYHSHSRESWLPELPGKDQPNDAFDAEVNVSLLGERMQQKLEEAGVGAVHSDADYNTSVPSFNYNYSYKYSKTTVKEALAVHKDLVYLFDIHRDSQRRKTTTVTIDGVDYAKLYFIIGQGNENWKENEAFATRIHEAIEERLPGLSKGILTKGTKHGHGEYNQSLSSNSVLIEIGGVDNTLEESYRTIDALASIVAEIAMEAEKVDAPDASAPEANPV